MGRPLQPWTAELLDLVAVEDRTVDFVLAKTAPMVPPGRAYRRALHQRAKTSARQGTRLGAEPATEEERKKAIRTGQRQIVLFAISNLVRNGRLVRYFRDEDNKTMLGVGPKPW